MSGRLMLVGQFSAGALERSYQRAFRQAGCEVEIFDMNQAVGRNVRFGRWGEKWNRFLPVEPWITKANRELVLAAQSFGPDVLVVVGQNPVRAGALAQIRATHPPVRTALIWPDSMVFLGGGTLLCLPLYDLVATYSSATVPVFDRLGAAAVAWIPLAADPEMHSPVALTGADDDRADVGFIGQWRPERESALDQLIRAKPDLRIKIWGLDWGRRCHRRSPVRKAWQGHSVFHEDFASAVAGCKINLNVIDPTNYPAANMRFFEIAVAGGAQVSSRCPEMETIFRPGETVVYYQNEEELPEVVERLLADDEARGRIAVAAQAFVAAEHCYVHRAREILERLSRPSR
jgi:spore maturation protein CgeB